MRPKRTRRNGANCTRFRKERQPQIQAGGNGTADQRRFKFIRRLRRLRRFTFHHPTRRRSPAWAASYREASPLLRVTVDRAAKAGCTDYTDFSADDSGHARAVKDAGGALRQPPKAACDVGGAVFHESLLIVGHS